MKNDTIIGIVFGSICGLFVLDTIVTLVLGTIFKTLFGINVTAVFGGE